jgi:hypothetical protein
MRRGLFRSVVVALLSVTLAVTGGAVRPKPAHAIPVTFDVGTLAVLAAVSLFGGSGGSKEAIEQAKFEIITAIQRSTAEITTHMERLAIAELRACIDTAMRDLINMDAFPLDSQITVAFRASECADINRRYLDTVAHNVSVDNLGYLSHVIFPIAMAARAKAGMPNVSVLETYIHANNVLNGRLFPACNEQTYTKPGTSPLDGYFVNEYRCIAYEGTQVIATRQRRWDVWTDPPINYVAVQNAATRNTSRALAVTAKPVLQETLPKLKRSFMFHAVQSGTVMRWDTQGPHLWDVLGNPGTATAVSSSIDVNNKLRHLAAVLDGKVHYRVRNEAGGHTPWGSIGSHPDIASAVSTAVDRLGRGHVTAIVNGQIYHRLRNADGTWAPWALLGNPGTATAITSAVDLANRLHLVSVIDGKIHHRLRYEDGTWGPLGNQANPGTATAVAAATDTSGPYRIHVVSVIDGKVHHRWRFDEGQWTPLAFLGNPGTATAITAASDPNNDLQVAVITDNRVRQRTRFQNGSWNAAPGEGLDPWILLEQTPFDSFGITAISAS